ncbi:hypothetical protein HNP99_001615 [Flavobacterium sp. 28A]|uniref:NUMOD4 domain-containing protein n=1 Tax=Flavobacterium sp. 28A TaxID=2735895 RepID=UPI00156EBB31|nr:NUMOD4 domain-containing protein [Flavobacterium sp. 28A]NRT15268.1 hypothetical protein [Flavobacterium sp. 28A]
MITTLESREEEWKQIPGYEDYQISSYGRLQNKHGRYLKGSLKKDHGNETKTRVIYSMTHRGKKYRIYASRLVAAAFRDFDLLDKNFVIDHIDNDSMNDNVENLQIITVRENNTKDSINKCGYVGVTKRGSRYISYITTNRIQKNLGTFRTALDAHQAYKEALENIIITHDEYCSSWHKGKFKTN